MPNAAGNAHTQNLYCTPPAASMPALYGKTQPARHPPECAARSWRPPEENGRSPYPRSMLVNRLAAAGRRRGSGRGGSRAPVREAASSITEKEAGQSTAKPRHPQPAAAAAAPKSVELTIRPRPVVIQVQVDPVAIVEDVEGGTAGHGDVMDPASTANRDERGWQHPPPSAAKQRCPAVPNCTPLLAVLTTWQGA
jgi:hypothetical protein